MLVLCGAIVQMRLSGEEGDDSGFDLWILSPVGNKMTIVAKIVKKALILNDNETFYSLFWFLWSQYMQRRLLGKAAIS